MAAKVMTWPAGLGLQHRLLGDGQGADQVFGGLEKQGFDGGLWFNCFERWIWNDLQHGNTLVC